MVGRKNGPQSSNDETNLINLKLKPKKPKWSMTISAFYYVFIKRNKKGY